MRTPASKTEHKESGMRALKNRAATCLTSFATPALVAAMVCTSAQLPTVTDHRIRQASYAYVPTATIDTSSTTVGISDSDLYGMTDTEIATALDTMVSMGVTTVRVLIPWAGIEVLNNVYNWSEMDSIVNAAAARGISVLGVITSSPLWASSTSLISINSAPNSVDEYAEFAAAVAQRYGAASNDGDAKISALEIWNEPNSITGYYPGPDATAYTDLLKAAYTAIKAVDSSMTVIGGVVGSVSTFSTLTENPVKFVAAMYAAGAAGYFDALSFHPYQYTMSFSSGEDYGSSALDEGYASSPIEQYLAIRALMDANGDTAKQIWATEYGLPTSVVSEADQAAFIKDFLATWSALTGTGPMYFYTLVDKATGSTNAEDTFGLYNSDGTPKDAVAVIMAWIQEHLDSTGGESSGGTGSSGTTTNPLQALADAVTAYFQQITASFQNAVNQFTSAFNEAITNAQNFFKQMAANFQNVIKTIQSWFGVTTSATQDTAEPTTTTESATTSTSTAAAASKVAAETSTATTESATTSAATESTSTTSTATPTAATNTESTMATNTATAPVATATTTSTSTDATAADPSTDTGSAATASTGTKTSTTSATESTATTDETASSETGSDTTSSSKSDDDTTSSKSDDDTASSKTDDDTASSKTTTSTSNTSSSTSASTSDESTSTTTKATSTSESDTSTGSSSKSSSTSDTPSTTSHTEASSKAA